MKNITRFIVLAFVSFSLPVFGGEKPAKFPVIKTPVSYTNEIIVRPQEVLYMVDDKKAGIYASFTASHDGKLKDIRVVMNDTTVYKWECQYKDGQIDLSDGVENGVSFENVVSIGRSAWVKFFQAKVAMPPFKFQAGYSVLYVFRYPFEYTGLNKNYRATFRVSEVSVSLEQMDFIFSFPREGKFYLGMKDGKFIPLAKDGDRWSVIFNDKPIETHELPSSSE